VHALLPRLVVAALAAAVVLAGAWAAPASAARSRVRMTCVRQTKVLSTPGGLVIGFLARRSPVIVLAHTANRHWVEVRALHSIEGWIHSHDLCS